MGGVGDPEDPFRRSDLCHEHRHRSGGLRSRSGDSGSRSGDSERRSGDPERRSGGSEHRPGHAEMRADATEVLPAGLEGPFPRPKPQSGWSLPIEDRIDGGVNVNHGRVEERQSFRFGTAEEERELGSGKNNCFDALLSPHPIDDGDHR